ncbi:hypothetical protein yrohd0001_4530 [Yersinia rohdei ATCC 43380]|nr:hypothetical protein yrohd0001_4530 [Yersinia rohdei ATCC 43380]
MLGCYLADIKSVSRSFPSGCFYIYDILFKVHCFTLFIDAGIKGNLMLRF